MTITAKIIKDSISAYTGTRITTFELEYPRFIHSELMTHRTFSRNAASSRAIPISKMMKMVEEDPAMPIEWGVNQAGMQAKELHKIPSTCEWAWRQAAKQAVESAISLQGLGLHKQIVNRVLEPFQTMKTIVTATSFDNFFWLRNHKDAQPEIKVLAEKMLEQYDNSKPFKLYEKEYHLPYIQTERDSVGTVNYFLEYKGERRYLTLSEAIKLSVSCCAQVSYRLLDYSFDKAERIYNQLVTMVPVHASPFENVATPVPDYNYDTMEYWLAEGALEGFDGVTHIDHYNFYSGNFRNWIQYRQLIPKHTVNDYKTEVKIANS